MNKVTLIGRLTSKPELKQTGTNVSFTRFSLAVNRNFNNAQGQREVDFINIVVWRKQAENVCNYLDKGSLVGIDGRIQTGSYNDKDGNKRYTTDVVADNVEFLQSKSQGQAKSVDFKEPSPYDYQTTKQEEGQSDPFADFGDNVSIDDNFLD